jgi:hypothetical protein
MKTMTGTTGGTPTPPPGEKSDNSPRLRPSVPPSVPPSAKPAPPKPPARHRPESFPELDPSAHLDEVVPPLPEHTQIIELIAQPSGAAARTPGSTVTLPAPAPAHDDDDQPFWLPTEEVYRPAHRDWTAPRSRDFPQRQTELIDVTRRPPKRRKPPRRPGAALVALIPLALLAAFFAWVSAEPLWLAVGHGDHGTATATRCSDGDVEYPCIAFTADGGAYTVENVDLRGVKHGKLASGASVAAEMVSPHSSRAYAADRTGLNLRWSVGLGLLLLCGLAIAWTTGAARLEDRRSRRTALFASLFGPLLLALGFLAATW